MKETKTKLPELKVQSFVTSLDDEQLLQINGAGAVTDDTIAPVCGSNDPWGCYSGIQCSETCTACSTTDHLPYTKPCGC